MRSKNDAHPCSLVCPQCGVKSRVLDTRPAVEGGIRRRRICENNHRFTTKEHVETETPRSRLIALKQDIQEAVRAILDEAIG